MGGSCLSNDFHCHWGIHSDYSFLLLEWFYRCYCCRYYQPDSAFCCRSSQDAGYRPFLVEQRYGDDGCWSGRGCDYLRAGSSLQSRLKICKKWKGAKKLLLPSIDTVRLRAVMQGVGGNLD